MMMMIMTSQENDKRDKRACYNCMIRHTTCDRTGTHCNTCTKRNLKCPGYGMRLQFAVRSSSPKSVSSAKAELTGSKRQRNGHKWIRYSTGSGTSELRKITTSSGMSRSPSLSSADSHSSSASIPPSISDLDPRTRLCFQHFATHVAPYLVLFENGANGYRNYILPMAHSEPLIEKAVCVASAFHLSVKQPYLIRYAEITKAGLIRRLSEASITKPDLSEVTWTALVLLVVVDIISGCDDALALNELLSAFLKARGPREEPATPLERFLHFESCLISFFIQPLLSSEPHYTRPGLCSIYKDYYERHLQSNEGSPCYKSTDFEAYFPVYEELFSLSSEICTLRGTSAVISATMENCIDDYVAKIRALCGLLRPDTPGAHAIVWPVFVAAAESRSDDDRYYFTAVLKQVWERTGHGNILGGLKVLPKLWARKGLWNWASVTTDYKSLFVC